MGCDVFAVAEEVLAAGRVPPLPREWGVSETRPVAWVVRGDTGAVLFLRLWRNGEWDSDLAVAHRDAQGRWSTVKSDGHPGWRSPYRRPLGTAVEWVGWTDTWAPGPDEVEDVDESVEARIDEGDDEVDDDEDATVGPCVVGLAGSAVVAVRTSEGWTTPVDPVTGLFILLFDHFNLITTSTLLDDGAEQEGPMVPRVLV